MGSSKNLESATCRKLARLYEKKITLSEALEKYDKARARYRTMVLTGDGSAASGEILLDHVAYVNALARYCTAHGVILKEIR